ncbi:DUF2798 domain-containing protein [Pelagibacterium sp. 26DY04]|uniref:DUF2798 domain-containing protein n=1 Tax=Pelagibacterium sp. 26DY04 TaxID=2967130 RepID=UPI00281589A7|nr:DUF2798 domain-containing protein [Pelagibacterium sp. 26DY04]WMT87630.1 DUF2798 domain-containing protein [Pelagibacterium sp. 26DY04]
MTDKKTLLLAQIFITFMMALSMSGIMSLLQLGATAQWLTIWPRQFIIAWPIAFVLTMVISRLGFALAHRITASRNA